MSAPQHFRATIQPAGKTATGIPVPPEAVEALGSGRQPLVEVTVDGYAYRSKIAVRAGEYKIPLALTAAPEAGAFFAGLSYSRRQRFVLAIEGAKTDETRRRRIAKAIEDLRAGKA